MSWNTQPQKAPMPPPYRKTQPAFSLQYTVNQLSTLSQSSFNCPASNQEACMYLSNSNTVSQPLPNVSNYSVPFQIPASNMPSRTVVASQTPVERTAYTNAKGATQPNHNLQVASGVMENLRLNSSVMSSEPSPVEATVSHQTHFGTNPANSHALQSQHTASDTCSVQLQVTPNSARVPVALQGSQGLNQSLPNRQVDWPQPHASDVVTFSDYRTLPKQHSYSAQSFMQDANVLKNVLMPSAPSQITYNQLPASTQSNQAAVLSYQYALQTSTRPPPLLPPYNCRYRTQPLQSAPHVTKHLSMEVPQSPETHSSEGKKDFCQGFQQQWQSTNENAAAFGNFCGIKGDANVRQPFSEPTRSMGGVQTPLQNSQEKRIDSCNPTSSQGLDTAVVKEKLARDIKSLVEIKNKFSELARKIRINKDLLIAAGCKPVNNSLPSEPAQHTEFSGKEVPAKSPCSMELVKTCLNLWKDKPSKVTEKPSNPAGEKQANEAMTDTSAAASKPLKVPTQNACSVERNPQNKSVNPLQEAALSVLVQNCEPLCANVTKGSELQIAVVSPLILSNVIKEITPETLPETVYPVIKEGSICTLQNQLPENAVVTAASKADVIEPVVGPATPARLFPMTPKEKQNEPNSGDSQDTPSTREEQGCHLNGSQTSSKPKDRTLVNSDLLQIESICSLVEGDVSYNSKIAKIFNSSPLKRVEPPQISLPSQQVFSTGHQEERVEQGAESKGDECVQYTDLPCAGAVERMEETLELAGSASVKPVEPGILEKRTPENVGMPEDALCSPDAAAQQDINSGDMGASGGDPAQHPAASESCDDRTVYLRDQLSELLKEFPYGIEGLNSYGSFLSQKKTEQVSEDQVSGKVSSDAKGPTDHIKITILSSEQMRELFPEEDEPHAADKLGPPEVNKSAETQKEKHVAEVGSQCDPQTPTGGESPDFVGNTDKIHCCALGWLGMIYEGVPKCRCNPVEKQQAQQALLETSSGEQGRPASHADVTVVKFDGVSPNPNVPLAAAAEKRQFHKIHSNDIKDASKTSKCSAPPSRRQELLAQVPPQCKSQDRKEASETKQGASANVEQQLTGQFSSNSDERGSSQRIRGVKNSHEVDFQSSSRTFSGQASQEGPKQKHTPQSSHPLNLKMGLFPNKGSCRRNGSFVQSLSPEKKKLKFKESGPREGHLEKRKLEQGEIPGLEIKKKRCNKQEQNKNVGVAHKSCNNLPNANERAIVKEDSTSNAKSLDFKNTRERGIVRDKTVSQMQSLDAKDTKERASITEQSVSQAQPSDLKDTRDRATVRDKTASQVQSLDAKHTRERASIKEQSASQVQASDFKDTRERATVGDKVVPQMQASDTKDPRQRSSTKEQPASQTQTSDAKDGPCSLKKVITLQEYFQRKKQNTAVAQSAKKICLENVWGNSASLGSTKLGTQMESCRRLNGNVGGTGETSKESSKVGTNHGKNLKAHLPEESKTCSLSSHAEGRLDGKQPSKTKLDKTLSNIPSEIPPQGKEQRKSYLNRMSFRCTERERICLTTFNSSSWKLGRDEKNQERKPNTSFSGKNSAVRPGLLEFKLCPDVLLKNTNSVEDKSDVKAYPEEQAAVQVSGIKSSRQDWIKCVTEKKRMQEANQEIGVNSRLLQRSASADGREGQPNLVKDSQAMFQTYKQLYLQKRGRNLGGSPGP
ncbi:PREDICTED: uncharacterized protein KIAA1551 homolog isoform X2 [Chinchilla lanigera]|uniref:uncharacterized protein KIAA1551 homolog isoform X2 n=1 Tax=Chinchilla lanigera TaxID=34839 RepID=UPI0006966A88|nr:PREDICTED: uncharacterized protein KIAA1551 homolog isoform X2 [Chinchilla lanigera]